MPKSQEMELEPGMEEQLPSLEGQTEARLAEKRRNAAAPVAAPAPKKEAESRTPFYRKKPFRIFFMVLVVLAITGAIYWVHARNFEDTDDAFIDGHVIPISPQISALVAAVHVTDNQFVHKGDLLVELNQTDFEVALKQAQGSEAAAKGKLQVAQSAVPTAKSEVAEAQAELDSAQVSYDNADRQLKRYDGLDARAKSQQQSDDATAAQKTAAAQVEDAKAKLISAQTGIASADASVIAAQGDYQKAQADTNRARINLGYCQILAPRMGGSRARMSIRGCT